MRINKLTVAILILVVFGLCEIATYSQRGYVCFGGEWLILIVPIFYYAVNFVLADLKEIFKSLKEMEALEEVER